MGQAIAQGQVLFVRVKHFPQGAAVSGYEFFTRVQRYNRHDDSPKRPSAATRCRMLILLTANPKPTFHRVVLWIVIQGLSLVKLSMGRVCVTAVTDVMS